VIGTTEPVKNKILVVSSIPTPRSLISQIIGKEDLSFRSVCSDEIQSIDWTIDNKYYTADVDFWLLNQHQFPPAQLPISVDELGDLCEALILVFDSAKYESFEKLHPWTKFVEEYGPSVLLCVGIGKCENKRIYNEWCVDNGLEFVEVETVTPTGPQTNTTTSEDKNEAEGDENEDDNPFGSGAEGRDRIIEALASTMWANMKQKVRRGMDRLEEQFSNMLSLRADEGEEEEGSYVPPTIAEGGTASVPTFDPLNFDEDLRLVRGEFQHSTSEITQNLRALQTFLRETEPSEGDEEGERGLGADSTEVNVEQFESALSGLRKLRENAQLLPDAQRKALAAQVISMLFPEEEWD